MKSRKRIQIVCPAKPRTRHGNRVTALRWQRCFRELGYRSTIVNQLRSGGDLVVALHASHSAHAVALSRQRSPTCPIVVAITGTDLYRDLRKSMTQMTLDRADRLVVLQPAAIDDLPQRCRDKTHVIYQSVTPLKIARPRSWRSRPVIVAGHIRPVKDPFRTALAVRRLPSESRIHVRQYGAIITPTMEQKAISESANNDRYQWCGEIPRGELRRRLARCWMMVLSSKMEGGANVLSEAIVGGTPVLATRISGSIGLLGPDYSGYFDVGDTKELRSLLLRCERDLPFYRNLELQLERRAHLFLPQNEQRAWASLLKELI